MITQDEKDIIIEKLISKSATLPCPRCGNRNFSLVEGYSSQFLQDKVEEVTLGGSSVPVITTICTKCGFLSQHSLGVLGLMPQKN